MNFEDDLRAALRRESPPPDFAAKVLAKAKQPENLLLFPLWRRAGVRGLAAGLALAAIIPYAAFEYRQREDRRRAIEAKDQFLSALRITRAKLRESREKVQRVSTRHNVL